MSRKRKNKRSKSVKQESYRIGLPNLKPPQILFDRVAFNKISHWVDKSPVEISGLGKVTRNKDGSFTVTDAMLLPQKNSHASTDIEAVDVCKAMYALRDVPGTLNFWWHSHAHMGAFWSGTDTDTIQTFGAGGWCIATVFNKRGERKSAFFIKARMGDGEDDFVTVLLEDIPSRVVTFISKEETDAWDAEYDKNVKQEITSYLPAVMDGDYSYAGGNIGLSPWFSRSREVEDWEKQRGYRYFYENGQWGKETYVNGRLSFTTLNVDIPEYLKPSKSELSAKRLNELTDGEWAELQREEQDNRDALAVWNEMTGGQGD